MVLTLCCVGHSRRVGGPASAARGEQQPPAKKPGRTISAAARFAKRKPKWLCPDMSSAAHAHPTAIPAAVCDQLIEKLLTCGGSVAVGRARGRQPTRSGKPESEACHHCRRRHRRTCGGVGTEDVEVPVTDHCCDCWRGWRRSILVPLSSAGAPHSTQSSPCSIRSETRATSTGEHSTAATANTAAAVPHTPNGGVQRSKQRHARLSRKRSVVGFSRFCPSRMVCTGAPGWSTASWCAPYPTARLWPLNALLPRLLVVVCRR